MPVDCRSHAPAGMQFVTLCVTRRFCDFRWIEVRLKSPFRPSATYFDGAKVSKPPGSVSGPTSSGSFALSLLRGSPQRAIHGPVRLAWRPARLPPDQRQDSAVTYVALCVVCAIVVEKHFRAIWLKARLGNSWPSCQSEVIGTSVVQSVNATALSLSALSLLRARPRGLPRRRQWANRQPARRETRGGETGSCSGRG